MIQGLRDQQLSSGVKAFGGCFMQRRPASKVRNVRIGTVVQQGLHELAVPLGRCPVQLCFALDVSMINLVVIPLEAGRLP